MRISVLWPCWSHGRLNWLAPCKPRFYDTGKTVRTRRYDVNLHDLADQIARPLGVHRLQVRRTPADLVLFPSRSLEQDRHLAPYHSVIERPRTAVDRLLHSLQPLALQFLGNLGF